MKIKSIIKYGLFLFFLLTLYQNCAPSFNAIDDLSTESSRTPTGLGKITFSENIKPILQNRCAQCHSNGGTAPFPLVNYAQVKSWGNILVEDLQARTMPPWGAKDDGSCQSFHNSMWLHQSEIDTFKGWLNQGALEGPPTADISPNTLPSHYSLNDPTVIEYKMPASYTPAANSPTDEYRCFVTDEHNVDRVITGFDVVVGNAKTVHHVIVFVPASESDEQSALQKGQGYECTAGPLVASSVAAFWAPGTPPTPYPTVNNKQTGLRIPAGRKVILQMHYNYATGRGSDQSAVRFKISNSSVKEGLWMGFGKAGGSEVIPRGQANFNVTERIQIGTSIAGAPSVNSVPGYIHAVFPHMHQVGKKIKIELNRNSSTRGNALANECLVDVPSWDFHWQRIYWFKQPVPVNALDNMTMTCTYNTENQQQDTRYGEGSADEMCFMFGFVTDSNL